MDTLVRLVGILTLSTLIAVLVLGIVANSIITLGNIMEAIAH